MANVAIADFRHAGQSLAASGMVVSSGGNLSIRQGENLIVTRHDSVLSSLTTGDLVRTGLTRDDAAALHASSELPVHRAIYLATDARAVAHAHPKHTISLSLASDKSEIAGIPVVGTGVALVPGAFQDEIASALTRHSLVMVRGHGSFAIGKTLDEAVRITIEFEEKCRGLAMDKTR